ncbi:uncharacterized protein LOC127831095 [Dreissena polymorpha]|uniref:uncharacterized protein LOC127831095 n=1 Tax=Dreissena polymorpha TaxID=45954 RepID=UPI0022641F4A|nr:uncharacterized protein LOC127831095 [Dreissena polymorpha]
MHVLLDKPEVQRRYTANGSTSKNCVIVTEGPSAHPDVVTNLSKKQLTASQIRVLSKGLKFVPTRRVVDKGKLLTDFTAWERRMRLREYFYSEERDGHPNQEKPYRKKTPSTWTPKAGRDKWLDAYIKAVKDDIIKGLKRRFQLNMSKSEEYALKELLNDDEIVIRPADKGSGIVVMDSTDYIQKLKGEISDSDTYAEVTDDKTKSVQNKVKKVVDNLYKKGSIDSDLRQYMTGNDGTSGKLQGNPKLHKPGMPLRTIVNGRSHPTEKMAEIVEDQLRSHVTSLPSFVRDTMDFLNKIRKLKQPLPEGTLIFCLDVKALYPSVPRDEARAAAIDALNRRTDPEIPTEDVIVMMDTVLENNTFSFNDEHFIQTEGTAIGSRLGLNYASTYMGDWEEELFRRSEKQPLAYFRFVDDVWGLWTHGIEALKTFHTQGNGINPRIKLELRYSSEKLEFLDTVTSIRNGRLQTDLYTKPTDKHLYLHRDSSHPESTKKLYRMVWVCVRKESVQRRLPTGSTDRR